MARKYSNTFAETTLTGSINNSVTTITIGSTTGLPASFPYTLAIDYGTSSVEMVTVTALAGSNLTVTRGQDGTSAQSHTGGARVVHPVTARDLSEPQVHIDATSDIHGLSGGASVVGTSQAQTLTNKTISGSNNTLSNVPNTALVAIDAAKVTQPFASMTVTGANAGAQVVTVTGDEVSRNKPIGTWIRTGSGGLVVGEDAVVQVTSGGFVVDPTQRPTGSASATARLVVKAQGKTAIRIDQNTAETNDFIVAKDPSGTTKYRIDSSGNVTAASISTSGALGGATAAVTGNATVGGTLGVTGALTASGGVSATGNVTASGTVQGATVTSTGAVTGASASVTGAVAAGSAAITGGVTTGTAGVTVAAETWHAMTLQNSWANFGSGFANAQYRKAALGTSIEIIGTISGGTTTNGTVVATLPAGYRPASSIRNLVYAQGGSLNVSTETPGCTLDTSGNLTLVGCGSAGTVAFHAIIPLDA